MYDSMIGNANAFTNRQHSCKIAFVDDTGPADVHDGILAWSHDPHAAATATVALWGVSSDEKDDHTGPLQWHALTLFLARASIL